MAGETLDPGAVDRALTETAPPPADNVTLPAAEAVRLRQRAQLADQLERETAGTLTQAALTEAVASIPFIDEIAATHARTLLRERIVVRPDENGRLVALDRESGRPAASALRELASGPEFARYRQAPHGGGGGGRNHPPDRPGEEAEAARRLATAQRMMAGRGGMPDRSFGGFANGKHGA